MMSPHGQAKYRTVNVSGDGIWDDFKRYANKSGAFLSRNAKAIAPEIVRALAPHLLSIAAAKGAEAASRAGVPDSIVNTTSKIAQKQAQDLSKKKPSASLTQNQKLVSSFLTNTGDEVLASMLRGRGVKTYGQGVKTYGQGLPATLAREAPRLN
jgi:hypothetical protein